MVRKSIWRSVRQRGVRHGTPANASLMFPIHPTIGRWMSSFPLPRHAHIRSWCKQWPSLSPPSFCPIVSSRVLIRSCCFFSKKKARNTYHDRTSAFTPPLLRGLGYLPAASCRGHRAPYSRAACLAQHAAALVAGLEKTWQMIQNTLARLTPADLEQVFPPLDEAERVRHAKLVEPALQPFAQMWLDAARLAGEVRPAVSLQWIIWHVLEHDIHHGSEISTILGVHGLPVVELD